MKIKKTIILLAIIIPTFNVQAKLWRVNNTSGLNADFTNFTAAQASASVNDTIYFEGSTTSYGDITLTKPLVIIGPGYFLSENPQTNANIISSTFGNINFSTGSSGSIITGLSVSGSIEIKVGNISIIKNTVTGDIAINGSTTFGNLIISQNYILGSIKRNSGYSAINNIIIINNYIRVDIIFDSSYSGIINNNCFYYGTLNVHNFNIKNNIVKASNSPINSDNTLFNNIGSGNQFPLGNGNQQNVNMADVFVGTTGNSTDGQWKLKAYSPAIKAGDDGNDCGMFGGSSPYILSGLPSIPSVYEINMPATGDNLNGIDVTIKAKTH